MRQSVGFACSDLARDQVGDLLGKTDIADGEWHHVAGILDEGKRLAVAEVCLQRDQ